MKKLLLLLALGWVGLANAQPLNDTTWLRQFLLERGDSLLQAVIQQPDRYQLQVIYTQINEHASGPPQLHTYTFGLDTNLYFYPASTVKMPVAFLALEKLNRLRIEGLDKDTPMFTGRAHPLQTAVREDTSAEQGVPSVGHYIRKIFLVSDNDAYNRLYEWLGQGYINEQLHAKGYRSSRIIHRLSAPEHTPESNRYTNPVSFTQANELLYHQGQAYSHYEGELRLRGQVRGKGYTGPDGQLIPAPFDFRQKNYLSLSDLHRMLQAVILPDAVPPQQRFHLKPADYAFLKKYMAMLPRESKYPAYPDLADWDNYVKFIWHGDRKTPVPPHVKILNKVGDAYGFLTDVAYFRDEQQGTSFFLSVTIHTNDNGIYNDGVYEYNTAGLPVIAQIGQLLRAWEAER